MGMKKNGQEDELSLSPVESNDNGGSTCSDAQEESTECRRRRLIQLLRRAAVRVAVQNELHDPWAPYKLHQLPAERVIRYKYHAETQTWSAVDETIVKMERTPFTHGAMRFCYRLKKRSTPPDSASNHRFHRRCGWQYATNYIAKTYCNGDDIDTTEASKNAIRNDIVLQHEAQYWANRFNQDCGQATSSTCSKILFLRAYAMEFPDRPGKPWFAVERYITGRDADGAGFVKHNTNCGHVETRLRRVTPQMFSAYSFYASHGQRMVTDIQGVGNMYTDPQVLSSDGRFGDGDLGPRGMALFFQTYRPCPADDLGLPVFPLSRNELLWQRKEQCKQEAAEAAAAAAAVDNDDVGDLLEKMDLNRLKRSSLLGRPQDFLPLESQDTARRSNITRRNRPSDKHQHPPRHPVMQHSSPSRMHRTSSDIKEVQACLVRARKDNNFPFLRRRAESGDFGNPRVQHFIQNDRKGPFRKIASSPNVPALETSTTAPTEETKKNLGQVHYELAILHGMGRFPEVVPQTEEEDDDDCPDHDAFSVLFHLSHAASLQHAPACLALARVLAGQGTHVSNLLREIVPTDFDAARLMLQRALSSPPTNPSSSSTTAAKVAAGYLLIQLLREDSHDWQDAKGTVVHDKDDDCEDVDMFQAAVPSFDRIQLMHVVEQTLILLQQMKEEQEEEKKRKTAHVQHWRVGDTAQAADGLEGICPSAVVVEESDTVASCGNYHDGTIESLSSEQRVVRQESSSVAVVDQEEEEEDEDDGNNDTSDLIPRNYELQAQLASLAEQEGDLHQAFRLYEQAAVNAMADGKKRASAAWSARAMELIVTTTTREPRHQLANPASAATKCVHAV